MNSGIMASYSCPPQLQRTSICSPCQTTTRAVFTHGPESILEGTIHSTIISSIQQAVFNYSMLATTLCAIRCTGMIVGAPVRIACQIAQLASTTSSVLAVQPEKKLMRVDFVSTLLCKPLNMTSFSKKQSIDLSRMFLFRLSTKFQEGGRCSLFSAF